MFVGQKDGETVMPDRPITDRPTRSRTTTDPALLGVLVAGLLIALLLAFSFGRFKAGTQGLTLSPSPITESPATNGSTKP